MGHRSKVSALAGLVLCAVGAAPLQSSAAQDTSDIGVADVGPQEVWGCTGNYLVQRSGSEAIERIHVDYSASVFAGGRAVGAGIVDSDDRQQIAVQRSRDYIQGTDGAFMTAPVILTDYADPSALFILSVDRSAVQPTLQVVYAQAQPESGPVVTTLTADSAPSCGSSTLTAAPNQLTFAVYLPRQVDSCVIGEPCTTGECAGVYDDNHQPVMLFERETMQSVSTTSERIAHAQQHLCLKTQLTDTDRTQIQSELEVFASNVRTWTRGDVEISLRYVDIDLIDRDMTTYSGQPYFDARDVEPLFAPLLDFVPDANFVFVPQRDADRGWHVGLGYCGLSGGEIGGAGWTWIPADAGCANRDVVVHEWLHQVQHAYQNWSSFDDVYKDGDARSYPACGDALEAPYAWFPDPHEGDSDPDHQWCGVEDRDNGEPWYAHIFQAHWDPYVEFFANHCKNGRQDAGESGVDVGGNCLSL